MKSHLAVFFVLALCLGATAYAMEPVVAEVPFGFTVENYAFPAGTYRIEPAGTSGSSVLRLYGLENRDGIFAITNGIQRNRAYEVVSTWHMGTGSSNVTYSAPAEKIQSAEISLVFHRYGNQYFLSKVWVGEMGREFFKGSAEKEAMAANTLHKPEIVILAAAIR